MTIRRAALGLALAAAVISWPSGVPAMTDDAGTSDAIVLSMHFDTPVVQAAAAFGPLAEAKWASEFHPEFVHPKPARDVSGAVFRTADSRLWLLHDFRPEAGFVQYVVTSPSEVLTLSIHVVADAGGSTATMTYDLVPLDERGSAHRDRLRQHSREAGNAMQAAISAYLKGNAEHPAAH